MSSSKTRARVLQPRKRFFAESAEFPRWFLAVGVVLIGFMLWLAAQSDVSGDLVKPGYGSAIYMVAVIGVALLLVYAGRNRRPAGKNRKL